jgi:hypothetical protein
MSYGGGKDIVALIKFFVFKKIKALIPAEGTEQEKIIPLNTPDGRPIFMNIENVIRPLS